MTSSFVMINATGELVAFCDRAKENGWLTLDTEFVRTRTLYAELGLVQARTGDQVILIDPLNGVDLTPLWQLLNSDIRTILHAAGEDLEIFHRHGVYLRDLFDSQIAYAFLADGEQIGYAGLVEKMLGVSLDKSQSRTDWLQRPLSAEQLAYAAADVAYLAELYPQLQEQVAASGKAKWLAAECAEQVARRARETSADLAWRDLGGLQHLHGPGRAIAAALAEWRLTLARQENIALPFVMRDHVLVDIAREQPRNKHELSQIAELHPKSLRRYGDTILACVAQGLAVPPEQQPAPIPRFDQDGAYKRFFKAAKVLLKEAAEAHGLAPSLLGSRKQINDVYVWQHFTSPALKLRLHQPDLYSGWRGELVAAALQDLVSAT